MPLKSVLPTILFLWIASNFTLAQEVSSTWHTNIQTAQTTAEAEGKPILLVFSGSDWCRPCMILKQTVLLDATFQQFAQDNLVLLEADFPRKKKNQPSPEQQTHNNSLAQQYNPQGLFPKALLLDTNGKTLQTLNTEVTTPSEFIDQLKKWKASVKLGSN